MLRLTSCVLCLALVAIAPGQTWQNGPQTTFRFMRFDGEYFPGTAKVYFLGGRLSTEVTDGSVWSYDPATGSYADLGVDMPKPVSNYDICLLRDDYDLPSGDTYGLYIVGGRYDATPNYYDSIQVYYPVTNRAIRLETDFFPGRSGGQITVGLTAIAHGNKMYAMGGFSQTSSVTSREAWVFDPLTPPGSRWTQLRDLMYARAYIAAATVDSFIIAAGGDTYSSSNLYARAQCQRLNVNDTAGGWRLIASMPGIASEMRAFGFDGNSPYGFSSKVITAGRGLWPAESANCYIYDVVANQWDTFPRLRGARRNQAGALIPGDQGTGVPGIWVWGGRLVTDTISLNTSEYYQLTMTGMEELTRGSQRPSFSVAPNPTGSAAEVRWSGVPDAAPAIRVYDVRGALVQEAERATSPYLLRGLVSGVYLVRLVTAGQTEEHKLVVTQ